MALRRALEFGGLLKAEAKAGVFMRWLLKECLR